MVVRDMHIRRIYNEIENGILYSCIIASWLYNVINCETVTQQHSAAAALAIILELVGYSIMNQSGVPCPGIHPSHPL